MQVRGDPHTPAGWSPDADAPCGRGIALLRPSYCTMGEGAASRPRGPSNFSAERREGRLAGKIGSSAREPPAAGLDPTPSPMIRGVVLHTNSRKTTMMLEQHIEELRAELRNAVIRKERRWIEAELKRALAELDAWLDEVERELREINHEDEAPPS